MGVISSRTAVIAALALLAGCAMSDDNLGRMLVAENTYTLYDCDSLADAIKTAVAREQELRGLMAKASTGAGGELVNNIAYRPEYLEVHGRINELRRTAAEKHCDAPR
ncbi:MAG: hypothetical protein IRY89_13775 [Pseudolabrys sp.]|nr:hypothetical protein [Pseudolabrys sp.]